MKRDILKLRQRLAIAIACFPLSLAPMLTACQDHVQGPGATDGALDGSGDTSDGGPDLTDGHTDDGFDTTDGRTDVATDGGFDTTDGHTDGGFDTTDGHTDGGFDATDGHTDGSFDTSDGHTDGSFDTSDGHTDGSFDTSDGSFDTTDGSSDTSQPDVIDHDVVDPTGEETFRVTNDNDFCTQGEWVMPQATAWSHVPSGTQPGEELGCPYWFGAWPPAWTGYTPQSGQPLNLYLNSFETQGLRDAGDGRCFYNWDDFCAAVGRLLVDDDEAQRVAPLREGADWMGPVDPAADAAAAPLDPALRARLAAHWLQDAQVEHASIASFARTTLELMRHGAPPALLAAAQQAAADEVDHAQRCLEQARRLGHAPQAFGPLDAPPMKNGTLAELAVDTLVEGCLGETVAITIATRGLERCEDPQARATLGRILDDETRHAALAWATVSWALNAGGEPVRQALMAAAADIEAAVGRVEAPDADAAEDPLHATLAAHGRVEGPARLAASLDAWRGIIRPNLVALGLLTSPGLG